MDELRDRLGGHAWWAGTVVGASLIAVLSLWRLGGPSLDQDEAFTAVLIRTPMSTFWRVISTREANQSGSFVFLRAWSHLGTTEAWLRLPEAFAAIGAVVVIGVLAHRIIASPAAALAPLFLGANAELLAVARFARGYAFVVLLTSAATLALHAAVHGRRPWMWELWAALIGLAAYFHVFAVLVLLAHLAAIAILPARPGWRRLTGPAAVLVVVLAPIGAFFVFRSGNQLFWVPKTTAREVLNVADTIAGRGGHVLLALVLVTCALAAFGLRPHRPSGLAEWDRWLVLLWLVVPFVAGVAASLAKPLLVDVYFTVCLAPLAVCLALGIATIRVPVAAGVLAVALGVLLLRGTASIATPADANGYRSATTVILQHAAPSDAFAVEVPSERPGVEYYVDRAAAEARLPRPCYPTDAWGRLVPYSGPRPASADPAVLSCASGVPHLWVVSHDGDASIQHPLPLSPAWHLVRTWELTHIVVAEWAPGPA